MEVNEGRVAADTSPSSSTTISTHSFPGRQPAREEFLPALAMKSNVLFY